MWAVRADGSGSEGDRGALGGTPEGVTVDSRGHLCVAGCDLVALAAEYGTPLYVLNEDVFRQNCRRYRAAFTQYAGETRIAYAGKALLTQAIAAIAAEEGLYLDVVSAGEMFAAERVGFPAGRIVFHGNNKSPEEIEYALRLGVGCIVVDNFDEIGLLTEALRSRGTRQRVLVRVAPGIEAHTHDYIQTGGLETKFGFDLESGQALEAVRRCALSEVMDVAGLHAHIGSQLLETRALPPLVERMLDLALQVWGGAFPDPWELNLGGGAGIRYRSEDPPSADAFAQTICTAVVAGCRRQGIPLPVIWVEPGRSIVGEAGVAVYRVGAQKRVPGLRPFVAVDGGMGDNIRPALYGAEYRAVLANRMYDAATETVRVVGRYCESGDFLVQEAELPEVHAGDLLAVFSAGAYQYPMASNYNRVPRPCFLLLREGRADVMVERESLEDLFRLEHVPPHLRRVHRKV